MYQYLKIKNTAFLLSVLMVISLVVAGCSSSSASGSSDSTNEEVIQAYGELDPQVSGQQIIADKKGYFKEEGLKVENHLMPGPDQNASLISSGKAQVIFGSIYNNISVAANDVDAKLIAPLANAGNTQSIVGRKGLEIKSAKDFEGLKIGATTGSGVIIAIQSMCEELGVDFKKIKFVNLQAADQLSALENGDVDAIAVWEPWVGKAVDAGGKILFTGKQSDLPEKQGEVNWLNFYMTVAVSGDFYSENQEDAVKFLRALNKATMFINEHPDEAAAIVAKEIKISEDDAKRIMAKNDYSMTWDQNFIDSTSVMGNFMKGNKNIDEVPALSDYATSDLLKQVDSSLIKVKVSE
ncbi:ABC transporter substrate-binding protein [Sporolactobacillus sp. THM19-2]|uniref:ABC transporter substrate-binding protein n=1 Tax=Sporolactobacillus sp. THM19-2 TaxID=2511171 RepID=UPI0010229785|nr:ABC transporter substrate-binding protein [Sporolactobacillus sp. THM19-2]RYL86659.1 ABC transporter substrate-binding protein [Sporolactobacillus sp. THM19-2]